MSTLLTTKLHIPRLPVQHVLRPRLLMLLQQGIQGSLTLVSAPAGSGKTTLLAEWAITTDLSVAWISLEAADNDPARFLAYLIAALASLHEGIDTTYQQVNTQNPEETLTTILNELSRQLEQESVLIMDDYHLLTNDSIHSQLRFLLDHLPTHLHLIIGTRVDPPLPLARLRARGQLSEIRAEELRFVSDEVEALISGMGIALSSEAANLLEQRTEGWIAGVQLLALALRGKADSMAFLQTFRGSHHFLLDYVSEEVLAQQTPETQRFLLRSSVLSRMTGPLCDAVTELPGGQARLAGFLRANLFVSALDDTETWYRYHALFAEALRSQLQKLEPELLPELYLRASRWYEQQHDTEEACNYALQASDFPRAAQLITDLLPQMIEQGRFEQLGRWLGQLPPALIVASPQLSIAMPWMQPSTRNSPEQMEQVLKHMEQQMQQQDASEAWVEPQSVLILLQALTAMAQNNIPRAFSLIQKALRSLSRRDSNLSQLIWRFLRISLGIMYGANGDLATGEQILLDLSLIQPAEPLSVVRLSALFLLGELYRAQGQLHKGGELYESLASTFAAYPAMSPMPLLVTGFSLMRQASLLYEWNRLPEAAHGIQQVLEILPRAMLEIIPRSTQPALFAFGLWAQARIEWAQGHPEAARSFLELVRTQPEHMGTLPAWKERSQIDVPTLVARLALLCDQLEEASDWSRSCGIHFNDKPATLRDGSQIFAYLTLARVLIAQGRRQPTEEPLSQALFMLEHWRHLASGLGFQSWLIEIQMLTALTLQAQGNLKQALTMLGAALAQAEPEGYVRLFADEGQPMHYLLAHVSPYTTASSSYLQRIQSAIVATTHTPLEQDSKRLTPEVPDSILPNVALEPLNVALEPLSRREREVLSLLAEGFSNQQIADHLVISLHTAKRHVKHILAKLSVTSRLSAVARARELHLL